MQGWVEINTAVRRNPQWLSRWTQPSAVRLEPACSHIAYCSQSDALTTRPLRPQSTLCYRNSTCGWCCPLPFKAKGLDAEERPILHHRTKFTIAVAVAEISRFLWFSRWQPPPSRIFKSSICRGSICITVPNFIKIGQTVADMWRFNVFFSKWRPSWICRARSRTIHEDYLVVFIVVRDLVWIASVLSIIWKF